MSEWETEGQGGTTEGLDDEELGGGMTEPGEMGADEGDMDGDDGGTDDEELSGAV
jgi:hypothetical protein